MFCRSISCLICTFVAVAIATGCSGQDSNTESSTSEHVQEVRPNTAVDLGALLDAGEGAVVALVAGDTRLVAHRAVLAARSPVFATMFQRIMLDSSTGEVALSDVEGPVLRQLLAYFYTLKAPQLPGMAPQLLAAADQYGLPALKADCEQQVAKQLSLQTAAATAALAIRHSSDSLREVAIAYIKAHLSNVMATQGWADAVNSQPQVMVKVMQLLSESPAETSTPASAASRTTPTIEAQSVRSSREQTAASAASPSTSDSSVSSGSTNICLCSSAPAESGSSPDPATQPHSDYSGHQTPTTAAPTTVAQTINSTEDVHISSLRSLSPEEKRRRLIEAAEQGAVGELEALLAAGADVGARDKWNNTALHWAAMGGHEEAARRLLAAGAAVDARDSDQWTPLHEAADSGDAAVVRLLLYNNADHSARSDTGRTPLHYAATWGHTEAAAALLQAGADRAARDNGGDTPLDEARRNNYQQVVQLLQGTAA